MKRSFGELADPEAKRATGTPHPDRRRYRSSRPGPPARRPRVFPSEKLTPPALVSVQPDESIAERLYLILAKARRPMSVLEISKEAGVRPPRYIKELLRSLPWARLMSDGRWEFRAPS